jgi:hypothetical protein
MSRPILPKPVIAIFTAIFLSLFKIIKKGISPDEIPLID